MNADEIYQSLHSALWNKHGDILDRWHRERPYLAHYTSLEALEKILASDEIWFSHPLLMNDYQEMSFGLKSGIDGLMSSDVLAQTLGTGARRREFRNALINYARHYGDTHAIDTYVFCMTEHEPADDTDGLLSMWRGYGGNGKGAAIVFDTTKIGDVVESSPLLVAPVSYLSNEQRFNQIAGIADELANLIGQISDEHLHLAAHAALATIKLFAITTKHVGFSEEREWRVIYTPENDSANRLEPLLGYANSSRGVEPKLRLKIEHIPNVTNEGLSLKTLIHSILLGPNAASPLALRAIQRMLESPMVNKPQLASRVVASRIPYRPQ